MEDRCAGRSGGDYGRDDRDNGGIDDRLVFPLSSISG
jgi:hypothetical protein